MSKPDDRSIELEIEVAGTPEEVWQAIATGPGITAWLHPTELEEHEGGRMTYDMGGGMGGDATVRDWDPPRRYVEEAEWAQEKDGPTALLATEWSVEARAGGTCVVRMVTSGFPADAAWDDEIEGFTEGMRTALANLRLYRERFPGERGTWTRVFGHAPGALDDGLAALADALGIGPPRVGDRVRSAEGAPTLAATVEHVSQSSWQRHVLLVVDEPAPGLAAVGIWGEARTATVQLCLYGERGAAAAAEVAGEWEAWMSARFPARAAA